MHVKWVNQRLIRLCKAGGLTEHEQCSRCHVVTEFSSRRWGVTKDYPKQSAVSEDQRPIHWMTRRCQPGRCQPKHSKECRKLLHFQESGITKPKKWSSARYKKRPKTITLTSHCKRSRPICITLWARCIHIVYPSISSSKLPSHRKKINNQITQNNPSHQPIHHRVWSKVEPNHVCHKTMPCLSMWQ